jgi:hypothetical protein
MFLARCLVAAAVLAIPSVASAESPQPTVPAKAGTKPVRPARVARVQKSEARTCTKPSVEVTSGSESATFSLSRCDGSPAPLAVDQLSVLARPGTAAKPRQPIEALAKTRGAEVAPGIRRIDARLVERLELAVEHFRKAGQSARIQLISGVRPKSAGSYHQSGRALDFRIEGVTNEALVAFCKTLDDTGCGYYPNSLFVHMDVRDHGAGHVAWIDVSKPGETPKYVSSWPLPKDPPPKAPDATEAPAAAIVLPALPTEETDAPRASARKPRVNKAFFF